MQTKNTITTLRHFYYKRTLLVAFVLYLLNSGLQAGAIADTLYIESDFLADQVAQGKLPSIENRLPTAPMLVDLVAKGRTPGKYGGTLRTMISRKKDIRQMVVYGYARLIGYDHNYELQPDLLLDYEVEDNRKFTFKLRPGHRWSDGHPFTSADFEYWWTDIANNPELSPSGPPAIMRVDDQLPVVTFPDAHTVVYNWSKPNPHFLPALAQARPPFIYRPRHYLENFHQSYAAQERLDEMIEDKRVRSWMALHNKLDNMYKFDNPALPTLQPWATSDKGSKSLTTFTRNPYYHRVDSNGIQLPYIDTVQMSVVGSGLIAAKANAGESDLQARGLDFKDIAILKKGEKDSNNYRVNLWANGVAAQIAIYPNLNYRDPVWRDLLRDVRFRRALSMGIDRNMINRALYFDLGTESNMQALSASPLHNADTGSLWSAFDTDDANRLLDEIGLTEKRADGIRLLPDGRPMRFVIETAGERQEVENALQIIRDTWRDIGIQLVMRPLDRDILRMHVYSGITMASVWFGWDNGIPNAGISPDFLAPTEQEFFAWPMWGQYHQTAGESGEAPDMPEAIELLALSNQWEQASSEDDRTAIWEKMLRIHAEQVYGIGVVAETPQPVVVSTRLKNVPEEVIWAWEPGAHFGIHRIDEFYFDQDGQ